MIQRFVKHAENIKAMRLLLELHAKALTQGYDDFIKYKTIVGETCPLCEVDNMNCPECPWELITGSKCTKDGNDYRSSSNRIKELLEWIEMYEQDERLEPVPAVEPMKPFKVTLEIKTIEEACYYYTIFNIISAKGTKKLAERANELAGEHGICSHIYKLSLETNGVENRPWDKIEDMISEFNFAGYLTSKEMEKT